MKKDIAKFRAVYHSSAANYDNTAHLTTFDVNLSWISGTADEEWIYVDLGMASEISGVAVHWGTSIAGSYELQISDDCMAWVTAATATGVEGSAVATELPCCARYVRILCGKCSGDYYEITKLEVFGSNALVYTLDPVPVSNKDGKQTLTGGNWKICRASTTVFDGTDISRVDYDDSSWLAATVPGTALVSYLNAGAIPNPDYDDWQFQISEAYFTADFWYRNSFEIPESRRGERVFICFEAINWKADVYFNGVLLKNAMPHRRRSIEGAFIRAKFDVTELVRFGDCNALALFVQKNDTPGEVTTQGLAFGPGPNGGLLGADNPTLHAAVGWDWLPTIRGRNTGIYGEVSLSYSGAVELIDPWIETKLEITGENSVIAAENLMLGNGVTFSGDSMPLKYRRFTEDEGFTVDFGEAIILGSATLLWGTEEGGAAADMESRHPELFRLETSVDGATWVNFDAYPGGEVTAQWYGLQKAEPNDGRRALDGHSISDSVQGATAIVPIDMTPWRDGVFDVPIFAPQRFRFLRFSVVKRRELNGRAVDTRVRELRVYSESPQQVEQSMVRKFTLDASHAELIYRAEIKNHSAAPVTATLNGKIADTELSFSRDITLEPGEKRPVEIPLVLESPKLWWPNTYGEQFLYSVETTLGSEGKTSDKSSFSFGVRRFDYPIDGDLLTLYCNGVRIVAKGGNWGIDDGMKRDTASVLDDKVRLHAEENMTMIRNWVGMTNHEGFYDACDKYGLLIWDDFWLANPVDGPNPNDEALFRENAADKIRRVRRHTALAVYCGRNESAPPESIDRDLAALTAELDGSRFYFPNSAGSPVGSGGGYSLAEPYGLRGIKQYFNDVTSPVLRSERGIPNVPNAESLRKFVKPENLWPISEAWALHDWTYHMNGPANTYMFALQSYLSGDFEIPVDNVQGQAPDEIDLVYREYKAAIAKMCAEAGEAWTFEDFSRAAQLINYDNHRGLFDALASRRSNGLLMWMSQSSWPSFMWQTYDFYLDTNGGYFGVKAGNQPARAVFDPRDNSVILANASAKAYENVQTIIEVFDLGGALVSSQTYKTAALESDAYGVKIAIADFTASNTDVVFLRLTLKDSGGEILGANTYWHNRAEYQNYRALNSMPKAEVTLEASASEVTNSGNALYTLKIVNGTTPALGVRVRLIGEDGTDVLPVFYSDNYLTMMPDETRKITAEYDSARLCGAPVWQLSGWNI